MKPIDLFCNKVVFSVMNKTHTISKRADKLNPKDKLHKALAHRMLYDMCGINDEIGWIESDCIDRYLEEIKPQSPDKLKRRLLDDLYTVKRKLEKII